MTALSTATRGTDESGHLMLNLNIDINEKAQVICFNGEPEAPSYY